MIVLRLLIKGDAIQCGENDFYCPCRTIDIKVADNVIDKEHEHIIGVEIEPQESEDKCKNCEYYYNPDYERCHKCKAESEDKE